MSEHNICHDRRKLHIVYTDQIKEVILKEEKCPPPNEQSQLTVH